MMQLKNEIKSQQSDTLIHRGGALQIFVVVKNYQPCIFALNRLLGLIRRIACILHKFEIAFAPLGHEVFHRLFA